MRYLTGDGVVKNENKARDLLAKSAAQGNKEASESLFKLTHSANSSASSVPVIP